MRALTFILALSLLAGCGSSGGIHTGDVRIENATDAEYYSSFAEVVGNVTVFSESLTNFAWSNLTKIDGNLFIQDSPQLESFSLSGLKQVDGAVLIKNNDKLSFSTSIVFPASRAHWALFTTTNCRLAARRKLSIALVKRTSPMDTISSTTTAWVIAKSG